MSRGGRRELLDTLRGRIEFELDGRHFVVPEHPVLTWMSATLEAHPDAVVPGLLAEPDARHLYDRLLDYEAPLDLAVCERVGLWVLEEASGRPWWEAQRALMWALDAWNVFDAWCRAEAQVDPLTLPLRSFCSLFVRFAMIATGEENEAWRTSFEAPPLGSAESMESRPEWEDEAVEGDFADAFDSFAALSGGMMPD